MSQMTKVFDPETEEWLKPVEARARRMERNRAKRKAIFAPCSRVLVFKVIVCPTCKIGKRIIEGQPCPACRALGLSK